MERIHGSSLMELVPLVQESILSKKIIPNLVNAFDSIEFHAAPILPKVCTRKRKISFLGNFLLTHRTAGSNVHIRQSAD
jgi:hypothetical protein